MEEPATFHFLGGGVAAADLLLVHPAALFPALLMPIGVVPAELKRY